MSFELFYRGYNHASMKSVCSILVKRELDDKRRKQFGSAEISQALSDFADAFVALQEIRISADYDPAFVFGRSDVRDWVELAETAIAGFDAIPADEKTILLGLMLGFGRT